MDALMIFMAAHMAYMWIRITKKYGQIRNDKLNIQRKNI
jgi:hypothetical protein